MYFKFFGVFYGRQYDCSLFSGSLYKPFPAAGGGLPSVAVEAFVDVAGNTQVLTLLKKYPGRD